LEVIRKMGNVKERSGINLIGRFRTECLRPYDPVLARRIREKFGSDSPEYRAIPRYLAWEEENHNIVTNEGLDAILDIMFHGSTQITTWYCALVETDTSPAAGMTYATPTYTESTAYDEATRPAYNEAASSSQSITNSANKATFTISGTKTMYGAAIVGGGSAPTTKGDAAGGGKLFCYSKFTSERSVVDDDVINLTYTLSAADDGV
jgi:hypothetical protein